MLGLKERVSPWEHWLGTFTTNKPITWPSLNAWSKEDSENRIESPYIFKWNGRLFFVWYAESKAKLFDGSSIWRITGGVCLKIPHCGSPFNSLSLGHKWNIFFKLIRMLSCYGGSNQKQRAWPTFSRSQPIIWRNVLLHLFSLLMLRHLIFYL